MAYSARPVPQNIMSVEFKLFDFMTLKQFMLAFGLIIICGLLFWLLPGPWKIIIPLFLIIGGGIIIFVPFNGEPFQEFVASYLEAMISPQRRVWNKKGIIVKTAYKAAKTYQFGNDPKDDLNKFKFANTDQITVTPEQEKLDVAEENFLHTNEKTMPNQSQQTNNSSYQPPVKQNQQSNQPIDPRMMATGTNISPQSISTSANLSHFQKPKTPDLAAQQNVVTQQVEKQQAHIYSPTQPEPAVEINLNHDSINQTQPELSQEASYTQNQSNEIPQEYAQPDDNYSIEQAPQYLQQESINAPAEQQTIQPTVNEVQNYQPQANNTDVRQTLEELNTLTSPAKIDQNQYIPKNYIFGNVEDEREDPINGAAVVIKQGEQNLEVVYTNQNGDFQSHYEYPLGQYTIHVNNNSFAFNPVTIQHDPIDPISVIVKPEIKSDQVQNDISSLENQQFNNTETHSEVFTGAYDPNAFKITDIDNLGTEPRPAAPIQQPSSLLEEHYEPIQNEYTNPQVYENSFENRVIDSADSQLNSFESKQETYQPSSNTDEQIPQNTSIEFPEPVQNQNTQMIVSYATLEQSNANFETQLIQIPNTLNGQVLGADLTGLSSVIINILDVSGNVIRSVATDPEGRFYTFMSLPNGMYFLELNKSGYVFDKYYINLDSNTIAPKLIKSK